MPNEFPEVNVNACVAIEEEAVFLLHSIGLVATLVATSDDTFGRAKALVLAAAGAEVKVFPGLQLKPTVGIWVLV